MTDKTLLILDDDAPLRNRLCRAMETRGFTVMDAGWPSVSLFLKLLLTDPGSGRVMQMPLDSGMLVSS